jgi:hypothetical protein
MSAQNAQDLTIDETGIEEALATLGSSSTQFGQRTPGELPGYGRLLDRPCAQVIGTIDDVDTAIYVIDAERDAHYPIALQYPAIVIGTETICGETRLVAITTMAAIEAHNE